MAVLAWVKSKKVFLKVQSGTGDALSAEDVANGFSYYVLWSTFRPTELDIDEELELENLWGQALRKLHFKWENC